MSRLVRSALALALVIGLLVGGAASAAPPASWIGMDGKAVPNFCAAPTLTARAGGPWHAAATWSGGRVPGPDDDVLIDGHAVTLSSDAIARGVLVHGERGALVSDPAATFTFAAQNVQVTAGGTLALSATEPGAAQTYLVRDLPFHALDTTKTGNGFASFGKASVTLRGRPKMTRGYAVSGTHAGSTKLTLSADLAPGALEPGDQLVVADMREVRYPVPKFVQVSPSPDPLKPGMENETVRVVSVSGRDVTFTPALAKAHAPVKDSTGAVKLHVVVINLTRALRFGSANEAAPGSIRGHTRWADETALVVEHASFSGLGRTPLLDASTDVINGVYPLHTHHLAGPCKPCGQPRNGLPDDQQFRVVGCAIYGNPRNKWGLVVHRSHWGLVRDNVVFNVAGAGLTLEEGEVGNTVEGNTVVGVLGRPGQYEANNRFDQGSIYLWGTNGHGIVFRYPQNHIAGNLTVATAGAGVNAFTWHNNVNTQISVKVPAAPGDAEESWVTLQPQTQGSTWRGRLWRIDGNTLVGGGWNFWGHGSLNKSTFAVGPPGTVGEMLVTDTKIYHTTSTALSGYCAKNLRFSGLEIVGQPGHATPSNGIWFQNEYFEGLTIEDAFIDGKKVAISTPTFGRDVTFRRVRTGVTASTVIAISGAGGLQTPRPIDRVARFIDCTFRPPTASFARGGRVIGERLWSGRNEPWDIRPRLRLYFDGCAFQPEPTKPPIPLPRSRWYAEGQGPNAIVPLSIHKQADGTYKGKGLSPELAALIKPEEPAQVTNLEAEANRSRGAAPMLDEVVPVDAVRVGGWTGHFRTMAAGEAVP